MQGFEQTSRLPSSTLTPFLACLLVTEILQEGKATTSTTDTDSGTLRSTSAVEESSRPRHGLPCGFLHITIMFPHDHSVLRKILPASGGAYIIRHPHHLGRHDWVESMPSLCLFRLIYQHLGRNLPSVEYQHQILLRYTSDNSGGPYLHYPISPRTLYHLLVREVTLPDHWGPWCYVQTGYNTITPQAWQLNMTLGPITRRRSHPTATSDIILTRTAQQA